MRPHVLLLWVCSVLTGSVLAQAPKDSSFSLSITSSLSRAHADDPHINRWLTRYGYPAQPRVPTDLNLEASAIPASSSMMYSLKASTIVSSRNLSSINLLAGVYKAIIKKRSLLLFLGLGAGYHADMITLNGDMPADYKMLAAQYKRQLSLHRAGLFIEPAGRAYWYGLHYRNLQLGLYAAMGYDMELNSRWRLGYYENRGGKYSHFKKIRNPSDQQKVSEYGLSVSAGLSLRLLMH